MRMDDPERRSERSRYDANGLDFAAHLAAGAEQRIGNVASFDRQIDRAGTVLREASVTFWGPLLRYGTGAGCRRARRVAMTIPEPRAVGHWAGHAPASGAG
jgi:hypothetical protein